ncbi:MAG: hypothetical protein KAS32_29140 [Candidatus Peribacteraceae bacterium]|nr:hypothetical protein [Candidatus Peribacteraceae bacterium]
MFEDKTINVFSSRDKIRNEIIEYAKKYLELDGVDFSKTSYLSYLINILSGLTANLIYYNTSVYKEFFLTKAVQKESILNLAAMLGFSPSLAEPASATLLVELPLTFSDASVQLSIPKGFKYYAGDIIFSQDYEVNLSITKTAGVYSVTATKLPDTGGSQVIAKTIVTTANGTPAVQFLVSTTQQETIIQETIVPELGPYEFYSHPFTYDGQLSTLSIETQDPESDSVTDWTQYDSLFLIPYATKGYIFRQKAQGGEIFFGNDVVGTQPTKDDRLIITLEITQGIDGNVIAGSINKSDRLYIEDYDSSSGRTIMRPVNMRVVNTNPATGGKSSPTIDEIRRDAISGIQTLGRLVSETDFNSFNSVTDIDLSNENVIHILKRSDIKRNEIVLFTDMIFDDATVPIRNTVWSLDSTSIGWDGTADLDWNIYSDDIITLAGEEYYSLFNVEINPLAQTSLYYYLINEINLAVTLQRYYESETTVLPSTSRFTTITKDGSGNRLSAENQVLEVGLQFDEVIAGDYSSLQCLVETSWDGNAYAMTQVTINPGDDDEYKEFQVDIPLSLVSKGELTFTFRMYYLTNPPTKDWVVDSTLTTFIRSDLDEFMYSQVDTTDVGGGFYDINIYDVPIIKKSYYDEINTNAFIQDVMFKLLSFDVTQYRMLTDFINLKYSNTTGSLDNMLFNTTTKDDVISINPSAAVVASSSPGDRHIVTEDPNSFSNDSPFIAEYIDSTSGWRYEKLAVDDLVYVTDELSKMIYTGSQMLIPISTIPLEPYIIVWKDKSISITSTALVTNVKNALVDNLSGKFGFDKPLYLSEIIDVVQEVTGVDHCTIKNPKHDIFFDYDIKTDLTQEELLVYSPELVTFDTSNISVEVR